MLNVYFNNNWQYLLRKLRRYCYWLAGARTLLFNLKLVVAPIIDTFIATALIVDAFWFIVSVILGQFHQFLLIPFERTMQLLNWRGPVPIKDMQTTPPPLSEITISTWKMRNVLKWMKNQFYDSYRKSYELWSIDHNPVNFTLFCWVY